MELRHLRYFTVVAEEENVTRAAARLNVSQPPLSRQIRDLEELLGVPLFERRGRSVKLTDAGRVFLAEARAVLARTDEAVRVVRSASGTSAQLEIGFAPSLSSEFLPRILRGFKSRAPNVRVILHDMTTADMLRDLRRKRLDAAFIARFDGDRVSGVCFDSLRRYRVGVMVHKRHRFAKLRALSLGEILPEPVVIFARQQYPIYFRWLRRLFKSRFKELHIEEESDGGPSLVAAVEAGRGIAVCSEGQVPLSRSRVRFIPFSPAPPKAEVGIAYGHSLSAHAGEFVRTALQVRASNRAGGPLNPGSSAASRNARPTSRRSG